MLVLDDIPYYIGLVDLYVLASDDIPYCIGLVGLYVLVLDDIPYYLGLVGSMSWSPTEYRIRSVAASGPSCLILSRRKIPPAFLTSKLF